MDASFRMSGCKITRSQLDKIWDLATEGFSPGAVVEIAAGREADGLLWEFEAETVFAMVEAARAGTLLEDTETVDDLELVISEQDRARSVAITISGRRQGSGVEASVTGENPGWARDRIGRLRELFAQTRDGWFTGKGNIRFLLPFTGFFTALPAVTIGSLLPHASIPVRIAIFTGALAVIASICYACGSWMDRRSRTEFRPHKLPRAKIGIGMLALVIGTIGAAAVIGRGEMPWWSIAFLVFGGSFML
jgi:uncharacterized iron-regulated membrane protein